MDDKEIINTAAADIPTEGNPAPMTQTAQTSTMTSGVSPASLNLIKTTYTKAEAVFALLCLPLGYLFVKFVMAGGLGIAATVFFLLSMVIISAVFKQEKVKQSKKSILLLVLAVVFSLYFTLSANTLLKLFNVLFVMALISLWCFSVNNDGYKGEGRTLAYSVINFLSALVARPMSHFGKCFSALSGLSKGKKSSKNVIYALVGLLIALPCTLIVTALLVSADAGFEKLMSGIEENLIEKVIINAFQIVIGLPAALYIFGMVFDSIRSRQSDKVPYEKCIGICGKMRVSPSVMMYFSVVPLCIIYVMFFFTQISYFLNAFGGVLPDGFTVAEYARRGFFELFWVAIINLCVIAVINTLCKYGEDGTRPSGLTFFTVLLSAFTLILIATAVSKMLLYISSFGLTRMRVYTTWFMLLLTILFVLVIIYQFRKIKIAQIGSAAFCIMFFMLCFSNVDSLIVSYNFDAYKRGAIEEFDDVMVTHSLSDDAAWAMAEVADDPELKDKADYYFEYIGEGSDDWRYFNVSGYAARYAYRTRNN